MNIVVLFEASDEQKASLQSALPQWNISELMESLVLSAGHCDLDEDDLDEFEKYLSESFAITWDKKESGKLYSVNGVNLANYHSLLVKDAKFAKCDYVDLAYNYSQLAFGILRFVLDASQIKSYTILCSFFSKKKHGYEFWSRQCSSGCFEDLKLLITNSEILPGLNGYSTIDDLKAQWCELTGESLEQVQLLKDKSFLLLVEYYNYAATLDKIPSKLKYRKKSIEIKGSAVKVMGADDGVRYDDFFEKNQSLHLGLNNFLPNA